MDNKLGALPLQVRTASEEDINQIVQLIRAAFDEYRGWLDPPSRAHEETAESIREKLSTGFAILAEIKSDVVGCVVCEPHEDFLYFGRLAVMPKFRGQGRARQLIQSVEMRARDLGCPALRLGVRAQLPDMLASYQRMGFQVIQAVSHPGYERPTYYVLEKRLSISDR